MRRVASVVGLVTAAASKRRRRPTPAPAPPADPDVVKGRLEARIEEVSQRELALAQRAGRLATREQDLDRRATELEEAAAAKPEPDPEPEPEPELYLFLLREHAHADGTLPTSFDPLVADVFGPLPQRDG